MSQFINEMEWSYRQAELAQRLERIRLLAEAKNLARLELEFDREKAGTTNKNNNKIGKETLGWN